MAVNHQMAMDRKLINIQEHCFMLHRFLADLDAYEYLSAVDWLDIAAGIETVKVLTAKHDNCLMYCGNVLAYENKRSKLLSNLTKKLTIFNFVWGSFESIAKIMKLPRLPKELNRSRNSIVDRTIWFLKQHYSPMPNIAFYDDELHHLRKLIEHNEYYKEYGKEFKLSNYCDLNGLGLHVVRKIRNDLAHGSAKMPEPDDWDRGKSQLLSSERRHLNLINTCTRIILLTVQMLLLAKVHGQGLIVECLYGEDGYRKESTAEEALHKLHIHEHRLDTNQLSLFE